MRKMGIFRIRIVFYTLVRYSLQVLSFLCFVPADGQEKAYTNSFDADSLYTYDAHGRITHHPGVGACTYDANGNLLTDTNKNITSVLYNHLNLPTETGFENNPNKKINYLYGADGSKVRKIVNDNGIVATTDYAGAYQYVNNDLKFINSFDDGYVYPKSGGGFGYTYYYTDQLDNIRLAYTDADGNGNINANTEIIKESHFYPFGLVHRGYNSVVNPIGSSFHKYDYQNQERQDELGLNWLQFKYRMQDPAIGRFVSVDALADRYVHNSTYAFAENKVIKYNELEGLEITLNKFDRLSYENKSWLGKAATFVGNAGISVANGGIDLFNYAGDLDRADQAAGGFGQGAGTKVVNDTKAIAGAISDYAQNTTLSEFGDDVGKVLSNVETYENIAGSVVGAGAASKISKLGTISKTDDLVKATNGVNPNTLNHIFGKTEHNLGGLLDEFGGSEIKAFEAVQKAANEALENGILTPNSKGILPSGDAGNIVKVAGQDVRLIGGRVIDGKVEISSFSQKDLN